MPKIQNMGASTPTLVAHPTRDALAADAVTRILDIIEHVLSERTIAHISLTGGTMGIATLKAWAENERVKDIDWSRVHFWFSDERYVPERSPERNDGQAIEVLLAPLLSHGLVVGNVHRMGPSDIFTGLDAAAEHYAFEMRDYAGSAPAVSVQMPEGATELPLAGGHGGGAGHEHGGSGGCGCGGGGCGSSAPEQSIEETTLDEFDAEAAEASESTGVADAAAEAAVAVAASGPHRSLTSLCWAWARMVILLPCSRAVSRFCWVPVCRRTRLRAVRL